MKAVYVEMDEAIAKRLDEYCTINGRTKRWVVETGIMQIVAKDSFGHGEGVDMVSLVVGNGRCWKVPRDFAIQYEIDMGRK